MKKRKNRGSGGASYRPGTIILTATLAVVFLILVSRCTAKLAQPIQVIEINAKCPGELRT